VADSIIQTVKKLLPSFKLRPYNENTGEGFLRHVLIKRGFLSGQVMVVLVTGNAPFRSKRSFVNALIGRHPEITTVVQNFNDRHTSLVLGERSEVLYGSGKIEEQLCGFTFRISPKAFYQINPKQTEVLYNLVREFACAQPTDRVLDAYCGTGTIGLILAPHVCQVIGVEINPDAVRDAKENAALNGVGNARFYTADAGEYMVAAAERGEKIDTVIMDPPRAGSSRAFLNSLLRLAPPRVVYVSCNPETLARDLGVLCRGGYKVRKIQPVDMFPHTEHVETVCLLERADSKGAIK
jgi:23S rRNA (uracil1939-C5)-methyltransferase